MFLLSESVGKTIRHLREIKHLSQEELSFLSDLHRTHIGAIERAEKNMTLATLVKIAKGLGVTPGYIVDTSLAMLTRECDENDDLTLI